MLELPVPDHPRGDISECRSKRADRGAFTIVDVMVSVLVIAVLVAVMLPSLSAVRTTTRKVLCASNTRQVGLGLHMYADDSRGAVPRAHGVGTPDPETFSFGELGSGHDALTLRLPHAGDPRSAGAWDGLGLLYSGDYLPAGPVFYCPSHPDEHTFDRYADLFAPGHARVPAGEARVLGNYQYRGEGPSGERDLFLMPADAALVTDAMGTQGWVNHDSGVNVLRAGLSVDWLGAAEGVTG